MPFTDTHVHLHFPQYESDRAEVVARAREAGVEFFVNVGTDVPSSLASIALAEEYPFFSASAGIHPNDVAEATDEQMQEIFRLVRHPKVVAIGEVGLDFYRSPEAQHDLQKKVLRQFIELHFETGKPLIIHCRDAYEDLIALFEEFKRPLRGVMHCYSSNKETLLRLVKLNFYISFAGPLTYKKNDELREACLACPLDRLLLETDAPFLPPQSVRGQRNESKYMIETAETAARLHGIPMEKLAEITTANAQKLFGLGKGGK